MAHDYKIIARIYDPLLYLALRGVRESVCHMLTGLENGLIVDLCCGTGSQMRQLQRMGFKFLVGIDLSPYMLHIARKSHPDIHFIESDASDTPLETESADAVIISLALHEKTPTIQAAVLAEAERILKPDGKLILADFGLDPHTPRLIRFGIHFIERFAGGEHFRNFKMYTKLGGLPAIMGGFSLQLVKSVTRARGGIAVNLYTRQEM